MYSSLNFESEFNVLSNKTTKAERLKRMFNIPINHFSAVFSCSENQGNSHNYRNYRILNLNLKILMILKPTENYRKYKTII